MTNLEQSTVPIEYTPSESQIEVATEPTLSAAEVDKQLEEAKGKLANKMAVVAVRFLNGPHGPNGASAEVIRLEGLKRQHDTKESASTAGSKDTPPPANW